MAAKLLGSWGSKKTLLPYRSRFTFTTWWTFHRNSWNLQSTCWRKPSYFERRPRSCMVGWWSSTFRYKLQHPQKVYWRNSTILNSQNNHKVGWCMDDWYPYCDCETLISQPDVFKSIKIEDTLNSWSTTLTLILAMLVEWSAWKERTISAIRTDCLLCPNWR